MKDDTRRKKKQQMLVETWQKRLDELKPPVYEKILESVKRRAEANGEEIDEDELLYRANLKYDTAVVFYHFQKETLPIRIERYKQSKTPE